MTRAIALAFALAAVSACGGKDKPASPPPAAVADDPAPVEAPAVADEPATGAAASCDDLCGRLLACVTELSGQQPSEQDLQNFNTQCGDECQANHTPEVMVQAAECLAKDACQEVIQCLQAIET